MVNAVEKAFDPPSADDTGSAYDESHSHHAEHLEPRYERPTGLKGLYYNTITQVVLLGFVCFMCPGLFNALNGLGGGGQLDAKTSANANSALYSTFAFFAFFAGYVCNDYSVLHGQLIGFEPSSVNNTIGAKNTLRLGSIGYALYISSYLYVTCYRTPGCLSEPRSRYQQCGQYSPESLGLYH